MNQEGEGVKKKEEEEVMVQNLQDISATKAGASDAEGITAQPTFHSAAVWSRRAT